MDQFILDGAAWSRFGRYDTTPRGNNWLDSNDITKLQLLTSPSTVFFFVTDVNDIDGALRLRTADKTSATNFAAAGTGGNLYFVAIISSGPIGLRLRGRKPAPEIN